ncbi:MAG: hypothetical protein JW982_03215 [Spirochaetes bacterium]|nr:hypothetical protein [Spirochaetota bacterium]
MKKQKSTEIKKVKTKAASVEKSVPVSNEVKPDVPENPEYDNGGKASKPSSGPRKRKNRIYQALRIVFIWIPLFFMSLIFIALIIAKMYLTPNRVHDLAVENFGKSSTGTLELDVKEFSPYSGFIIENLIIRNSGNFDKSIFVKIDKLVFHYGFFDLFTGNVHFDEIGIYKPSVFISQKKNRWNFEDLFPAGEKQPEPPAEKKSAVETKPAADEKKVIKLPIDIEFFLNFKLADLGVYVDASTFSSKLEGFSSDIEIYVPPFSEIPRDVTAVQLLKKMQVKINPDQDLQLTFNSKEASVKPPLVFTFNMIYFNEDGSAENSKFSSTFKFGTYKSPVRFQDIHLIPLNFMVSYDLYFDPIRDYLNLNSFIVKFNNDEWINLTGNVTAVSTEQKISLKMKNSRIDLNELYPYYVQFTKDQTMKFSGNMSLYPLTVKGTADFMTVNSEINMNDILFRMPDFHFSTRSLKIRNDIVYRTASALVDTEITSDRFTFLLGRETSKANGLYFSSNLLAYDNFSKIKINSMNIRHYNPVNRSSSVDLTLNGLINLSSGISGNIQISKMIFRKDPLIAVMPQSISDSLKGIPLEKPVTMTMNSDFRLGANSNSVNADFTFAVPDFSVRDLKLNAAVVQDVKNERININNISVASRDFGLNGKIKGFAAMKNGQPLSDSDISVNFALNYPQKKNVYGPWNLGGSASVNTSIKGSLENLAVNGTVDVSKLNIENTDPKMLLAVKNFNLKFPFNYAMNLKYSGESKIIIDKSTYISNENFTDAENFTIDLVEMKHPSENRAITYVSDLKGIMFFRNSTFEIPKLRASIFGGNLLLKDTLFYLADLNVKNMEYKLNMALTNLDVYKIQRSSQARDSAQLSFTTDISGRGLDFANNPEIKGSINIYKIGRRLASNLMKGLTAKNKKSTVDIYTRFAMDNSLSVKNMFYSIENGNIYTTVNFTKRTLGFFVSIKEEKIEFQRIPVQQYLNSILGKNNDNSSEAVNE